MPRVPSRVYLETSVFVGAVVAGPADSKACLNYCGELASAETRVHFSELMYLEFIDTVSRMAATPRREQVDPQLRAEYQLDQWTKDASVRRRWLDFGDEELDRLLAQFHTYEIIPIDGLLIANARAIMIDAGLRSNDALHVATARLIDVRDFATSDRPLAANASSLVKVILIGAGIP